MLESKNENIKKVAIYTRVSTEDQAKEGFSLDAQLEKLKHFCLSRGWEVYKIYAEDGYSGRNIKRPKYQEMFNEINFWDAVVVLKMDRIHRNSKNFMNMMEKLFKLEKEFVSTQESFDTSNAMGRFVMDIVQRIAQLESEQTGERTFTGMYQKAKDIKSGWMGHWIPFGFIGKKVLTDERYASGKTKTKTVLEPDPEKIEIVKQIFNLANKDNSLSQISKKLDLKYSTVHYIIHNPFYAGLERWTNKLKKTNVEPVISRELFNKVQLKVSNKFLTCNYAKDKDKIKYRSKPLQLPLEDVEIFEIPKEDLKELSSIRFDRFKHPVGI